MKKMNVLLAIAAVLVFQACAMTPKAPVMGVWYTDVTGGEAVTSNTIGTKHGESCATSILGLVATGDASIGAAAKSGGLKNISYVDGYSNSILGLFAKYCTRVYGN